MKKFTGIAAIAAAAGIAVTLAGCGGCSGCNTKTVNNALTNSNWFTGTGFKGIQPFFILSDEHPEYTKEEIVYDVTFDNSKNQNKSYSVEYKDGSMTTEFYATRYNLNSENIPESYRTDKTEVVYYYKTSMNISVRYIKGDASTEWFEDSVTSECYFRAAEFALSPLYSKQVVKSASPKNFTANSLENCYERVDRVYENFYNDSFTEVTSYLNRGGENEQCNVYGKINKHKNTVFDNSSLYIAVRSMKLNESFTQGVDIFSAMSGGFSTINVSGSNSQLGGDEHKAISAALADKGLYSPVTTDAEGNAVEDKGVPAVAVTLNYAGGGSTNGAAQTVWYAAIENANNNTARTSMLKLSVPVSYGLGTLNYTLKEVKSTIWNG